MARIGTVRYGVMEKTERFALPEEDVTIGNDVVIRTRRGVEWGRLVAIEDDESGQPKTAGEVLRKATRKDVERQETITDVEELEEAKACKKLIKQHELPMKLVRAENLFGGNKIIFYFLAEGRVDFRGLVRDLAKDYRTRIEMRQIGVRDEARIMGLVGPCGGQLCCRTFMDDLKPVPMKLAKDQKSTLDPAKISGSCGRLKCCLKFEEQLYKDLKRELPRRGSKVGTPEGEGVVVDFEVIGQTVTVELADGTRQKFPVPQITRAAEE